MPLRAPKGFIDETDPKVAQIGHPAPAWLVNYADLMTELVCFFVILYALSAALNKDMVKASQDVKKDIQDGKMAGDVKIDKDGLHITLQEQKQKALFASGSSDTTSEMETIVAELTPTLKALAAKHDIVVEGHTDNQRISNDYYDSNWELSTARATSVVRLMIEKFGFPPEHMAAIGYGQFRPLVANDSPANMSKNRRVVFWVKNNVGGEKKEEKAPPKEGSAPGKEK